VVSEQRPQGSDLIQKAVFLAREGQLEQAEQAFIQVRDADPNNPDSYTNLGVVLRQQGKIDAALASYQYALSIDPKHSGALYNCANILRDAKRFQEAYDLYSRALTLNPDQVMILNNLGLTLQALERQEEAIRYYHQAQKIQPDQPYLFDNIGNAYLELENIPHAIASYRQAIDIDPNFAPSLAHLGIAYSKDNKSIEAVKWLRRALAVNPDSVDALNAMGNALRAMNQDQEGIACFKKALEIRPNFPEAISNLGVAYNDLGDLGQAISFAKRAVDLSPRNPALHWTYALVLLRAGKFKEGWAEYEWRWERRDFTTPNREFGKPRWDGSPINGKIILIHAEQGIGDTLQFIRYVALVAKAGGTVIVECQPEVVKLVGCMEGVSAVVRSGEQFPEFDVQIPLLSLPLIFGTGIETILASSYLAPPVKQTVKIKESKKKRVGLAWAGSPTHNNDRHRSVSLEILVPLFNTDKCEFFSLQVGSRQVDIQRLGLSDKIKDLSQDLKDFSDTASAIDQLDLVVSVDTAIAHLAGGMGKPVWILLPFASEWRWLTGRDDSPWYPSMRLFRQQTAGNWEEVVRAVKIALDAEC
jgi:tetratricopeptide (TPR) repeat protein